MSRTEQKQELFKTIWDIANDLRGSVDGWEFKQYILGFLFYRFISENLTEYINRLEEEASGEPFDYAAMPDEEAEYGREETVREKGFFILPSQLFCNVAKNADKDENLNMHLREIFDSIEGSAKGTPSEQDMSGLFDDIDTNSNKLGNTVIARNAKLANVLKKIGAMELGKVEDHSIDAFGDAYEYLMTMYASNAGKSGGEFFTPQEVSELLARIATAGKTEVNKVYDPACGSGSLLLQVNKVFGADKVRTGFFGQEINITTYNLCRINMFLHNINYEHFDIQCGDTLLEPKHWDDEPFDVIVSNPPYSIKWVGEDDATLINDPRFAPAGVLAPKSKADLAFAMHMLAWLSETGTAAIVEFPGVLYRGGKEQKIRKYLIENNYVDTVIQLPANLFFGVSIATCIIVLKKNKTDNSILFIDASNEFAKATNKNVMTDDNIQNVLNAHLERKDIPHFCSLVKNSDVVANDSNLSVSSYVEQEDTREKVDIAELTERRRIIVNRVNSLRVELDDIINEIQGGQV